MTLKEKLQKEHPDKFCGDIPIGCPDHYGYETAKQSLAACCEHNCESCWDREIWDVEVPETEEKREENAMENTVKTTKKTKSELLEELEAAKAHTEELEKEIADLEKFKKYKECADEMAAVKNTLVDSGFSDDQAFQLLMKFIDEAAQMSVRRFLVR